MLAIVHEGSRDSAVAPIPFVDVSASHHDWYDNNPSAYTVTKYQDGRLRHAQTTTDFAFMCMSYAPGILRHEFIAYLYIYFDFNSHILCIFLYFQTSLIMFRRSFS